MDEKKQELGIKETKELLEALARLAVLAKKIGKDGKINAADLQHLIAEANQLDVILDGVKGADEIPAELKDLDELEVLEIVKTVYQISDRINEV